MLGLHKSWHGLHWLISQDPWEEGPLPLKNAIFGEAEIGEDLTGYGPPKLNSPERVQEIERALAALSATDLIGRFNGKRMDELEIYPGNFGEDSSWRGDLRRDYSLLREFYKRAAQSGDGVVTWIA